MKIIEAFMVMEWTEEKWNILKRDDSISQMKLRQAEDLYQKAKTIFDGLCEEFLESN